MAQSLAGFTSILKEFYLGPIQDQLNEETLVCDMFEKGSVDWNGRLVHIPVHVGRNTAVAYAAEGAALPGGGALAAPVALNAQPQQVYTNLTVNAEFLYGRFTITGPAMASAGKGGANSFVGWVDSEMTRLVNDIKNRCNRTAVSGGLVLGFANHNALIQAADPATPVLFTGDTLKVAALVAGAAQGDVDLVRVDTYASILTAGTAAITAVSAANGTVTVDTAGGDAQFNLAVDPTGTSVPVAVVLTAQGAATIAAAVGFSDPRDEPVGIYANLGLANHFGVDRTTATGTANALQCGDGAAVPTPNITMQRGATGAARTALAIDDIQNVLDRITVASDDAPDTILCHPLQRTRLVALLQGTINFNSDVGASGEAKMGFSGFSYAGLPIKTSRHVDNGGMWFIHSKSWKMLELESGKFADEDGSTLSRVSGADAFEGFYKWYYNVACVRPNCNGALLQVEL